MVEFFCYSTRMTRQGDNPGLIWLMELIRELACPNEDIKLQDNNGWQWRIGLQQYEGWTHQTYQWKAILAKPRNDYSELWQVNLEPKMWGSLTYQRDKVLLWRVLTYGFYHNRRGQLWGVCDGICPRCRLHIETIDHLFFECHSVRIRWENIGVCLMGTWLALPFTKSTLGEILYTGIMRAQRSPLPLVIIMEMIASIWRERNVVQFCGDRLQVPISRVLTAA